MGPVQGSLRSSAHVPLSQMMKPAWKRAFTVLGLTAAVATALGAGYAVLNTEFNRLVPATVTVRSLAESADVNGDGWTGRTWRSWRETSILAHRETPGRMWTEMDG